MKNKLNTLVEKYKDKKINSVIFNAAIDNIALEVAEELNLPIVIVRKVIDSQFRLVNEVINSVEKINKDSKFEDYESVRLIHIGSFRPSWPKFSKLVKFYKEKYENNNNDNNSCNN